MDENYRFNFYEGDKLLQSYSLGELLVIAMGTGALPNSALALSYNINSEDSTELGGEELFDRYEHELRRMLSETAIIVDVSQKMLDDDRQARSWAMNVITWSFFGATAARIGLNIAQHQGWLANTIAALTGGTVSTFFNGDIPFYKDEVSVGDKLVFVNGKVGVFRNGIFVAGASSNDFWQEYEKLPSQEKEKVLLQVGSSAGNGGGPSDGSNGGGSGGSPDIHIVCTIVYTNSGAGDVSQRVCWPERS